MITIKDNRAVLLDYNNENVSKTTLASGVTILTEYMPGVESVALGVWADAGSVDEDPEKIGVAHFLEHMLFKGTKSRTAFQLAEAIEDVGGQLNAYTEHETTHVYTRVLAEHLPLAVELLADMVCHSTFDQTEMDRERQVIIEEIRKYDALPEEQIHDLIMKALWHDSGLGHPILGDEESVLRITRDDLLQCWRQHFAANRILVTAAGKVHHESFVAMIDTLFADLPPKSLRIERMTTGKQLPCILVNEDEEQVTFCWGGRAFPAHDERTFTLALIDATLGASTTSRLFQEIREKRGLAYDVSSYAMGFRETGLLCASGACSPTALYDVLSLIRSEVENLHANGMTDKEFIRAKQQIKADVALSLESTTDRMQRLALHQLTWGTVYPLQYLMEKINHISLDDVNNVLMEVADINKWVLAAIGPIEQSLVQKIMA
ncbi:MAG TPA: pitrilysin family protein [Armatimonadota bacterium]|nr:pitrilysin family protein [Armatimonadota bacterium]